MKPVVTLSIHTKNFLVYKLHLNLVLAIFRAFGVLLISYNTFFDTFDKYLAIALYYQSH